jgi:hypothetical protein
MTAMLSCPPVRDHGAEPALVPAAGTSRRLQSLSYMGHPVAVLAADLCEDELALCGVLHGRVTSVRRGLAAAVADLYDRLWDVPGPSGMASGFARLHNWCPPMAWDDDPGPHHIDDPAAAPADWQPRRLTIAEQAETIAEVMTAGVSRQEAAWRLGIGRHALDGILWRAAQAAPVLAAGGAA